MEKRVLLAVLLSFVVLTAYQVLFPPPKPQPRAPAQAPAAAPTEPPGGVSAGRGSAQTVAPGAIASEKPDVDRSMPSAAALLADTEERDVVVENDSVRAIFTTRGAALKSWRLKKYLDAQNQPLELVPGGVPDGSARPFLLAVDDAALTSRLQQALYKPSATALHVNAAATLTFEYKDAAGLSVRKDFTFTPEQPYVIGFTAAVIDGTKAPGVPFIRWGPAIGSGRVVQTMGIYSPPPQPIFYKDGEVTRVATDEVALHAVETGAFGFAGVDDHYFLSAALPGGQPLEVRYHALQVPVPEAEQPAQFVDWTAKYPSAPVNARFFFGPKDFDVLASIDRDLVRAIHFGMFSWLVVPLLRALKWINAFVGNYGWSIIILTALINIAMFPLRHKSVVSMRRMQEIQPEIKAIQERYSKLKMSDPARGKMNTEMMNLYRERGVNPASGCVPMLLTLPVLFAFYAMLSVAIELRGAPFVGWIRDLSVYDPYFITPVVMGATQFVQTKMTPSTADPMQQKMMLFMPLLFMFMFLWAPSGLVLYWTVSNMWAIGQQALTNRLIGPPAQHVVRPPAERRVKNAGGGRSEQASKERK